MSEKKLALPPFRALLAFQAAATHDRLADAAARIGVTESAVSHQLKQLETLLHVQLFDRASGRLKLTPAGRRYLERIEPALREIQDATEALLPSQGRQSVRLTMPPSLGATWLIPRLGDFEAAYPDVDVQLVLTTRIVDMRRDQIDLAVRYGRGAWAGVKATFLFEDLATPVAAPGLLPADLSLDALPNDVRYIMNRAIPGEWEEWARARGLAPPVTQQTLILDSIEQVLQVAETGHGLAMGRSPYVEERLARGTLVAPFGRIGPTGAAYYLCRSETEPLPVAPRRLAQWLSEQAAAFAQSQSSQSQT